MDTLFQMPAAPWTFNPANKSQALTPAWAGRELWEAFFSDLGETDSVLEPTCGDGRMLQAVPPAVPAFGVEIDPGLAHAARARTGRLVLTGDVLKVDFPQRFNAVFGNPPFEAAFMDQLLARLVAEMDDGGRCGLIVPAYFMQTPSRVIRWNRDWSLAAELLPRTLFPRLSKPIIFALFTKDPVPSLRGLRLFIEADAVEHLKPAMRRMMTEGKGLWSEVVAVSLHELGGEAPLDQIYSRVSNRRPTENQWWREKVRQTLQRGPFENRGRGVWALKAA
jgi:hypothetical protein